MKTIYFVRHGESESNVGGLIRGEKTPLTQRGRKQAEILADRFTHIPIDLIITSTYERARDTAAVIADKTHCNIIVLDYIHEQTRSSSLGTVPKNDPKRAEVHRAYLASLAHNLSNYKHSDEETFTEILDRVRKTKQTLESRPEQHILVVTHGIFLRLFHAYVLFGDEITPKQYLQVLVCHKTSNTGITIYDIQPRDNEWENSWKLRTWMDVAHLGD